MIKIHAFEFNPFSENTYVISDSTGECIIVDPGCYDDREKEEISSYIKDQNLRPVKILLTHAHIDHILGNNYLSSKYRLPVTMSEVEIPLLNSAPVYGQMWGVECEPSPQPEYFVKDGDVFTFGNTALEVLFTPGHSPGSMSFLHRESSQLISGDVLFLESIGRTDLPGGDFPTLEKSIREKLFTLDDDVRVFPGHGGTTTIGHEKKKNPFIR